MDLLCTTLIEKVQPSGKQIVIDISRYSNTNMSQETFD